MYDDLNDLLSCYIPQEVVAIHLDAYSTLTEVGITGQDAELLNIMGIPNDHIDGTSVVGSIEATLSTGIHSLLLTYGVVLNEETPLTVATEIARSLSSFNNFCFSHDFISLFEEEDKSDVDILSFIIATCSRLEEIDVTHYITSIRPSTLTRIKSILEDQAEVELIHFRDKDPDLSSQARLSIVNRLMSTTHGKQQVLVVKQLAEKGFDFNTPLSMLLDEALDALDMIDDPHGLAVELLALCVYSTWNWKHEISALINEYFDTDTSKRLAFKQMDALMLDMGLSYVKE